ncbi:hypothetical protein Syun_027133 [Stephania yunnanensis]|uniref:Receptor-like serine/threonine-protein kinase n=1 Tax=Stephania yunnanensis TaxID=152371 RepID=A0AAP0EK62_9MAGN
MASFFALLLLVNFFANRDRLFSATDDTITPNKFLRDGDKIVSNGGTYALGFFSPGNSQQRYIGIWYNKDPQRTVVWVANREDPINGSSSGVVKVDERGNLGIFNGNASTTPIWSTKVSILISNKNSFLFYYKLLNSGNLVLCDGENGADFLWRSFDYPTDTYLPGMKVGFSLKSGLIWTLTSWKSPDDPSTGDFTFSMSRAGMPEVVIKNGSQKIWRSGPWTGDGWNGVPGMKPGPVVNHSLKAKRRGLLQREGLQKQLHLPSLETNEETNARFELPIFDLNSLMVATDNFSIANKLGAGGFGSVYKGKLSHGREIAVKRLSKNSGQGMIEFKNEIELIAKLQHRNLVQIIGCCIEEDEKMIVYEYMPNKSLDFLLFDQTRSISLDWRMRCDIILGIARGVLYLHQDSRLRIIHRDLKASNVLLDAKMNPKISDFGMARIFGGDQSQANTRRVVGTYGYMSPEYAMDGLFSIKSDVFSFGVILLETISGRKNTDFYHEDPSMNLIKHAWELWRDDRVLELIDPSIGTSFPKEEVVRFIQVGILCVQENARDRPTMSSVIFMLGNEKPIPSLKQPAFVLIRNPHSAEASASSQSLNEMSITIVEGR